MSGRPALYVCQSKHATGYLAIYEHALSSYKHVYFRGRFALEALAVWAVLCLPINLLTCYMVTVAPDYDHLALGERGGGGDGEADGVAAAAGGGNLTEAEGSRSLMAGHADELLKWLEARTLCCTLCKCLGPLRKKTMSTCQTH